MLKLWKFFFQHQINIYLTLIGHATMRLSSNFEQTKLIYIIVIKIFLKCNKQKIILSPDILSTSKSIQTELHLLLFKPTSIITNLS